MAQIEYIQCVGKTRSKVFEVFSNNNGNSDLSGEVVGKMVTK